MQLKILCANPLENRAFQGASESALEICNRKVKMVLCGGGDRALCGGTNKSKKLQKSSKNGTYATGSETPT